MSQRDENGRMKPGFSSNPGGRPKGSKGLARYIKENTMDAREMADVMISIFRGLEPEMNSLENKKDRISIRMDALKWLTDRSLGTAAQIVIDDIDALDSGLDEDEQAIIDAMSTEDKQKYLEIMDRAAKKAKENNDGNH